MKWRIFFIALALSSPSFAETYKQVFNPQTGVGDFVTALYTCGSGLGFQFTDTNKCTWCETVSTGGSLMATLINCPSSGDILLEASGYILKEDGVTKISVE